MCASLSFLAPLSFLNINALKQHTLILKHRRLSTWQSQGSLYHQLSETNTDLCLFLILSREKPPLSSPNTPCLPWLNLHMRLLHQHDYGHCAQIVALSGYPEKARLTLIAWGKTKKQNLSTKAAPRVDLLAFCTRKAKIHYKCSEQRIHFYSSPCSRKQCCSLSYSLVLQSFWKWWVTSPSSLPNTHTS